MILRNNWESYKLCVTHHLQTTAEENIRLKHENIIKWKEHNNF